MQKKVFITGISGFAGSHLARHLLSLQKYSVSGTYYSKESLSTLSDITDAVSCIQVDLTDKTKTDEIIKEQKPDFIYHLAALASPAQSFTNPLTTITDNVSMQINLLEAVKTAGLLNTRILVVSSAYVYGAVSENDIPIDEQTPFRPTNPYAISKITQDYVGLEYALAYNLGIIRVRPFNHIGSVQTPQFVVSAFAKQIAEIEKNKKEPVMRVGNIETKRDFTDVRDMVRAYTMILEKGDIGDVYNIGTGKGYKIADILDILLGMSTVQIDVKIDEALLRPTDTPELVCDNTKFVQKTGWQPEYTINETLQSILDYWRKIV